MTNLGDGGAPGSGGRGHRGHRWSRSNRGRDESSGSPVATASPGYAGGRSSNTPRRHVDRHGGFRAPGTRLSQKGTQVAHQIFTEARDKDVGPDRRNVPWCPKNALIDTVACLQRDLADMKTESQFLRTRGPTRCTNPAACCIHVDQGSMIRRHDQLGAVPSSF